MTTTPKMSEEIVVTLTIQTVDRDTVARNAKGGEVLGQWLVTASDRVGDILSFRVHASHPAPMPGGEVWLRYQFERVRE